MPSKLNALLNVVGLILVLTLLLLGKKAMEIENDDIDLLEKLSILPKSLSSLSIDTDHPLHNVANDIRKCIKYNVDMIALSFTR